MFVREVREYWVTPQAPTRPPQPYSPPRPASTKGTICCMVIIAIVFLALGINAIKAGNSKNNGFVVAEGAVFIALAGCCFISLAAIAIHQCVKARRERRPVTNDYTAMPV